MKQGAQLFAYLKQLLKLYTRQRDKAMMLSIIEEVSSSGTAPLSCPRLLISMTARNPTTVPRPFHYLL